MHSLNKSFTQKNWRDLTDDELKIEISKIIERSSNEKAANLEIKNSLEYPYHVSIHIQDFESRGLRTKMYMFMAYSKDGEILMG